MKGKSGGQPQTGISEHTVAAHVHPQAPVMRALVQAHAKVSTVGILCITSSGQLWLHNEHFQSLCGVPDAVLRQGSMAALLQWLSERGDEHAAALSDLLSRRRRLSSGEFSLADGRAILWRAAPFHVQCGAEWSDGWVWAFEDVTARRRLTSAVQDAETWLRRFAAHTQATMMELDEEARILETWAAGVRFFEKPDAELRGKRLPDAIGERHGLSLEQRVRQVLSTGRSASYEYSLRLLGEQRVFTADAVLLPGGLHRVTLLIHDVTERVRRQSQLLQADRLASVGLLAAGVAHEINNPLGYMLINLERLKSALRGLQRMLPEGEQISGMLHSVQMSLEGSRRVRDIVCKLRRLTRSDGGQRTVPVDVRHVLSFAAELAYPAVRNRAHIVREFGDVPEVLASEGPLGQVFLNLIMNAAQAIPEGLPDRNAIRLVTATDPGGDAVIEVHDSGTGIASDAMQYIFDPFFTTKDPQVGTGLGLGICHGIVTSFGGRITVASEEGRGSVFRVTLPPAARG